MFDLSKVCVCVQVYVCVSTHVVRSIEDGADKIKLMHDENMSTKHTLHVIKQTHG